MNFEDMERGYANLWAKAEIRAERRAAAVDIAKRLAKNKDRYALVASWVGNCPWWWVAAVHELEASANFTKHLHNGDPLARRTIHVPAGRPVLGTPPFTWEDSAADALKMHHLQAVPEWSLPRCLYEWERFNGFGYVAKRINSPYVWSFTTLYTKGKYVADGKFDRTAVSSQCGTAAILKGFVEIGAVELADAQKLTA